jgi:hypothetical protein
MNAEQGLLLWSLTGLITGVSWWRTHQYRIGGDRLFFSCLATVFWPVFWLLAIAKHYDKVRKEIWVHQR